MKIAQTVAEILDSHVTLEVECIDRMYLNLYVPGLQHVNGAVGFSFNAAVCRNARPTNRFIQVFGSGGPRLSAGNQDRFLKGITPLLRASYCGSATFLRRAFTRGSPRSSANSGELSARPMRTPPSVVARSKASNVRSLSPKPA